MGQGVTFNRSVYLSSIVLILFGCKVEHIKSDYLCFNADNHYIDGSTGTSAVFRVDSGHGTQIGYSANGGLVLHSECAAALTIRDDGSTTYVWFEYGREVEYDSIQSLRFFTANQRINLHARRNIRPGIPTEEYSERSFDYNSRPQRTRTVFYGEFPYSEIDVRDHYDQGQFDKSQLQLVQRRKSIDGTIIPTNLIVCICRTLIRYLILGVKMKRV
ncbi:TPA: hypothetical protein NGU71_001150 [Vibrio parahaemolyticus]|uniref:hypothetical protein n=1 Tax=Vibrio parahaemolyticus TaxID=670 RepID=UPI000413112A|nr:hypothetical protein [Vibrio parahaemolyticus]EJE1249915.1 hypothetical protein [Vibrio parahaemolyticus]EJG1862836.1 hypothetical protein [Vibrio parahaemolyticus]EKA4543619.1 hypothetical protein [Vibrio parahaemolyticus]ELB2250815.1 hypothetical protein [Vibrio parahaemolyticus]MBE4049637.1 hypothetical protein [Vibrio parahaemolyticus]